MARRVSLTLPTALVLAALSSRRRYGFELMEETGLPSGTIYPLLRRFEARNLVEASWEGEEEARSQARPPRRYYRLTPQGEELAREAADRYPALGGLTAALDRS